MVSVLTTQVIKVQGDLCVIHKTLKKLMNEIKIELPHKLASPVTMKFKARTAREVDHHTRKRFIEWHVGMAITTHTLLGTNGLCKGLANGYANVFHRMMRINFKVTLGLDREVDQAMPGNLIKHMVKERNPRVEFFLPRSIKVEAHEDLGFGRISA